MFTVGVRLTGPLRLIYRLGVKIFMAQSALTELRLLLDVMVFLVNIVVFVHCFSALDTYSLV
ncbi:MAG: hypothetical protein KAJ73_04950 [Zetaproteobacteria bacterium]|nr:hypothetical protein [Zetaproteobacteria bacterium]